MASVTGIRLVVDSESILAAKQAMDELVVAAQRAEQAIASLQSATLFKADATELKEPVT